MTETISVMRFDSDEPEHILRDALSQCAEMRSRGAEPYLVLLIGEENEMPQMGRTPMYATHLAACSARLELEMHEIMRELYSE